MCVNTKSCLADIICRFVGAWLFVYTIDNWLYLFCIYISWMQLQIAFRMRVECLYNVFMKSKCFVLLKEWRDS